MVSISIFFNFENHFLFCKKKVKRSIGVRWACFCFCFFCFFCFLCFRIVVFVCPFYPFQIQFEPVLKLFSIFTQKKRLIVLYKDVSHKTKLKRVYSNQIIRLYLLMYPKNVLYWQKAQKES